MSMKIAYRDQVGQTVKGSLFGGNSLFHIDDKGDDQFEDNVKGFGISGIRWPGGAITENFFNPAAPDTPLLVPRRSGMMVDHDNILTFSEIMQFSKDTGQSLTLVLPTIHLLKPPSADGVREIDMKAVAEIKAFVEDALAPGGKYADARIAAFELGNEYWSAMTAKEYGKICNVLSKVVDNAIMKSGAAFQPDILIQVGTAWGPDFKKGGEFFDSNMTWRAVHEKANQSIIDQLDPAARSSIDGLIDHYYTSPKSTVPEWTTKFIQSLWQSSGISSDLHFTEWNVNMNYKPPGGVPIFSIGSAFAETFEAIVRMGASTAFVWPVNQSTPNDLGGSRGGGHLSVTGGVFKLLSENVRGLTLKELTIENDRAIESSLYTSGRTSVLFLSRDDGRAFDKTIDLTAIAGANPRDGSILRITEQRVVRNAAEDHYVGVGAGAKVVNIIPSGASNLSGWSVKLNPYEVTMIKVEWVSQIGAKKIFGSDLSDRLIGKNGAENFIAHAGHDTIIGNGGDDTLHGGAGNDYLDGGGGNDVVFGGAGADRIFGAAGNDRLFGGAGSDMIVGGFGNDTLVGESGNDRLTDLAGNNFVDGGLGDDIITTGAGTDRVLGGAGKETIRVGGGNDVADGGNGNDTIFGENGNDNLTGGAGNDIVSGGSGADTIYGGADQDRLYGNAGNDLLVGQGGNDLIYGSGLSAYGKMIDDSGADTLIGGHGNDTLYGGGGNDVFQFGTGLRDGGAGQDIAFGGSGADIFVFQGVSGWTRIMDFQDGVDKISFRGKGIDSIDDLRITQCTSGGQKYVRIEYQDEGGGGIIRLDGPQHGGLLVGQLTASDFIF